MRIFTLPKSALVFAFALIGLSSFGQSQPNQIATWLQSVEAVHQPEQITMLEPTELVTRALPVPDADYLSLDHDQLASLFENQPALINFHVPRNGQMVNLKLARVNVTSDDFTVNTDAQNNIYYKNGIHYRGIVDGDNSSVAALSFFNGEVMGFYNNAQGNYTIGRVEDEEDVFVVYNAKEMVNPESFGCFTEDPTNPVEYSNDGNDNRGIGCKVVKVYFECDYALYVNKGSNTTNVTNYVTGLFNQIATLYANENIDIQISEMYVWTSTDPYASLTSTSSVLNSFKATKGTNFNGNLAHFLTTRNLGGGIAYVDVICTKSYAFGVSMIYGTYSSVPTYSWSVECVTHELGHNLGSPHTQSCSWTGGALDNCYTVEGSCSPGPAPTNGGTIMSYCHLTSVGINFNNGFGAQPGNLIRSRVLNATCLASSGAAPTGLATSSVSTGSAILAWVAVPGATQYTVQYKTAASSTWITATTTSSISYTLSGLASGTAYNWQVKTDCSGYSSTNSFTTTTTTTSCATVTGLTSSNISTSFASLTWGAVSGASSYTVQYKPSAVTTWSTLGTYTGTATAISGLASSTTYNWQVKASCATGYSAVSSFTTATPVSTSCTAPTGLTTTNIGSTSATLNWNAVSGASSYSIKYRKSTSNSWTNISNITGTSRTITNLTPGATYQWRVRSSCNSTFSTTVSFATVTSGMIAVDESGNETLINLYPNPVQNEVHVMINGWNPDETGFAKLYSVTGALLSEVPMNANENVISVNQLPAGVYFIHVIKEGNEPAVARFVKD